MAELRRRPDVVGEYRFTHPAITIRWAGATDRGMRRRVNEDSVFASFPVFVVADGMGGHAAGDVASALAIEAFRQLKGRTLADVEGVLAAVETAFDTVREQAPGDGGSTLSGAVLVDVEGVAHWLVVNVGDSRTYLLRDGSFEQISVDHSVVQELVDAGTLAAAAARSHPQRNVITRALGAGSAQGPDYWLLPAERGQRLLVCSDGLSGEVDDAGIAAVLARHASPADAANALISDALLAGARDNVSLIVADVDEVAFAADAFESTASVLDDDTVPRAGAHGEGERS